MQEQTQTEPKAQMPRLAWSIDELAEACGVGRDNIYRAIRDKRLRAKKLGNRTLIPEDAARSFIADLPDLVLGDAA